MNVSPYSVSVKALPKFAKQGGSTLQGHDDKGKKGITINIVNASSNFSEQKQGGQNNSSKQGPQTLEVQNLSGLDPSQIETKKLSNNNLTAFQQDGKQHLPPLLDGKTDTLKKRGGAGGNHPHHLNPNQKALISSTDLQFSSNSLLDHSQTNGGPSSIVLSNYNFHKVGGGLGQDPKLGQLGGNIEDGFLPSNDEVINGMDHLTPNPSNNSNYNEERFSRISHNVQSNTLGSEHHIMSHDKISKTDLKHKQIHHNTYSKAAQILQQSPYNSANQSDHFQASLKKQTLKKPHLAGQQTNQFNPNQQDVATFKKGSGGEGQTEISPVSRNLQFNNMVSSQTLMMAANPQDNRGSPPQVRPQKAHSHTRKRNGQMQQQIIPQNTGPHMILRQSKNKQIYQQTLQQHQIDFHPGGGSQSHQFAEQQSKKNMLKAHLHLNMKTVHEGSGTRGGGGNGFRFNNSGPFSYESASQGFQDGSNRLLGMISSTNERNQMHQHRDSILGTAPNGGGGYSGSSKENMLLFSGSGIDGRLGRAGLQGDPESFSERCSSIEGERLPQQEEFEENFNIGRGGVADSDKDVRLFRDIEIRLKIEPLSLKLLQGITDRIRSHMHGQGKPALANLFGLLYQQAAKLTQRLLVSPPSMGGFNGGNPSEYQSRTQMNIIKQLQAKNADLNAEVNTLSNEIHALKLAGAASFIDPETQNPQVRELIHKNQELLVELESLKERLAIYESTDRRDLHGMVQNSLESISPNNIVRKSRLVKQDSDKLGSSSKQSKLPVVVPQLNLNKALQINMKINKVHEQQFQVPLESSDRGSYMGFKLHQNFNLNAQEEIPVPQIISNSQQQLVRPTTTMGGRKKVLITKQPNNDEQHIQEEGEDADLSQQKNEGEQFESHHESDTGKGSEKQRQGGKAQEKLKAKQTNINNQSGKMPALDVKPHMGMLVVEKVSTNAASVKKLQLKVKGFHDEFMEKYDEFSLSWREAIDREKRF